MTILDTTQILFAIIALLLFGIFCALVWNIRNFTNKQGKHQMQSNIDITPPRETCMDEDVQTGFPGTPPATEIADTTEPATEAAAPVAQGSDCPQPEETPSVGDDVPPSAVIPPQEILPLLRQLVKDFETKLKYDASKQELIDKLYKENMEFKEGVIKKFQQAMITAVIERIDDAAKDIAIFENREFSEENYRKLLASYRDITAVFQDMLSVRFDVECYSGEPLMRFDPKTQRSLKTCPTTDADRNKLVKQTLRPGYRTADGFVLRPELVEVYVFDDKQ